MKYKVLSVGDAIKSGFENLTYLMAVTNDEYTWCVFEMDGDKPVRLIGNDGGDPEDQILVRDWSWVVTALNEAYEKGVHDGASNPYC
jgi:hypothetical protein